MENMITVLLLFLIRVDEFKGANIQPCLYYVETENHNMMIIMIC
jgi:hypothetical protein